MGRYPCILQDDSSTCGIACLATVARCHGEHPSWNRLREVSGTLSDGVNLAGLSEAATGMGYVSRAVAAVPEALPDLPTPFIAHVIRDGGGHFVVVHKVGRKRVVVADPAEGLSKKPLEDFLRAWTGRALLLAKEHPLPPTLEAPGMFSRLLGLILPHRRLLLESLVAATVMSALAYGMALVFSNLVDRVFPAGQTWTLHLFGILALALVVSTGLFSAVNTLLLVTLAQRVSVHLMFPALHRLLRLPMGYFESRRLGDILHRFSTLLSLKSFVINGPVTLALDGMVLTFASLLLFLYHWQLAAAVVGALPLMLLATLAARYPLRRANMELLQTGGKFEAQVVSTLGGIASVKAFGAEGPMTDRVEVWMGRMIRLNARMTTLAMIPRVVNGIFSSASLVLLYWLGGAQVMAGTLSLGQLIFSVTLAGSIFPAFRSILDLVLQSQEALATLDRATDIVDVSPEPLSKKAGASLPEARGEVRVENVSFRYGQEEDTLKDVSLAAGPGEAVAIIGKSGCGKSTLLKLLLRFYEPRKGRILVDGADLRDWDLAGLRSRMAWVDQECRTFAGSLIENLRLGGGDIPIERLVEAVRLVGLQESVERLPARYEADVGEDGARLSGGERQRLALARAVARRPKILLLDEATSQVDPQAEKELFPRIREALPGTTIIMATHRLALAQMADRVAVMMAGQIIRQGPPGEVLRDPAARREPPKESP
jgi:ATP-binding cassette subfamily B protein